MPAIQASMLSQMGKLNFKSKGITLPMQFGGFPPQAPFGAKDQAAPDPMALFLSATTLNLHVDTSKTIGKQFEELIDACSEGIGKAFSQWQSSAKFVGVLINGPVGMSLPGGLVGAPTMAGPAIMGMCNIGGKQPEFIKYVKSITHAIGTAFTAWQTGYMVTLSFPGGAVCSVTMVPSPNIPVPIAAGSSPGDLMMSPAMLKGLMLANHGKPGNHTLDLFDAFAQAFSTAFTQWKATTMISNVLGAGGVAPPPPAPPGPVAVAVGNGGALP